jgi:hypothetical protein
MPGVSSTTAAGFAPQATAPAAALMNVPGIVNAETVLSMKPIFDGTNPTTIGVSDAAAPGTSLLAAHRDHQHASPATFPATAHNLLSTTHGDTLAASVADGSIIIGNVTPKWSTLAISVPAANLINVLGVVNGETRPSWKALLDATTPAAIGTGAAGTATTASHRDHVHSMGNLTGDVTSVGLATTNVQASSTWAFTGDITPAQITADQNDYNPAGLSTASVLRLSSDSTRSITGLAGGADGRILTLINTGVFPISLVYDSASSTAANRFYCPGGTGVVFALTSIAAIQLIYDSTSSRWRVISTTTPPNAAGQAIAAPGGSAIGGGYAIAYYDHVHAYARWIPIGATLLNNTVAAGATVYAPPFYSGAPSATQFTFTVVDQTTFGRLYCRITNAQPAGGSLVVNLRNTSAGTNIITLTIAAGSAAGTYSEVVTFPAAVAAGVQMTFQIVNNAGAAVSAQIMSVSVGMVPV